MPGLKGFPGDPAVFFIQYPGLPVSTPVLISLSSWIHYWSHGLIFCLCLTGRPRAGWTHWSEGESTNTDSDLCKVWILLVTTCLLSWRWDQAEVRGLCSRPDGSYILNIYLQGDPGFPGLVGDQGPSGPDGNNVSHNTETLLIITKNVMYTVIIIMLMPACLHRVSLVCQVPGAHLSVLV